jgi:hypothetical protein
MFSWKKINKSIKNFHLTSTRMMGGYLANSAKKIQQKKGNKKNRTHKSPNSGKSHMSSLFPAIMNR